jgi:hypothetical protein
MPAGSPPLPPFVPDSGPFPVTFGGTQLSRAWLVTLTYPGVPQPDAIERFGDFLPDSGWLHSVGDEYGVALAGHSHFEIPVPYAAPSSEDPRDTAHTVIGRGLDAGWW